MEPVRTDLAALVRDTLREALHSWRLPATLVLGLGFGLMEYNYTGRVVGFLFGPAASIYTLLLGPLPWRALVPLEEDGRRAAKLLRAGLAVLLATGLFAGLALGYYGIAMLTRMPAIYTLSYPRELLVSHLLFLVGGWGLARDIQLEQRLDRTLGSQQKLSAELAEARLLALRADLDPHFLFNALNTIASQCVSDGAAAEQNIVRLAGLLRAVLDTRQRPLHPLEDELALAGDYLGLLAARFPTLRVSIESEPAVRGAAVPPLVLQPLLENAVRHGRIGQGEVRVRAGARGRDVVITVESPGPCGGPRRGGLGLDLVRRRVALAWDGRGTFEIGTQGGSTVATIVAGAVLPGTEA